MVVARAAAMPMIPLPTLTSEPIALLVVAVGGDRVEPTARLVEQQEQRVREPEHRVERLECGGDQGVEVTASAEAGVQLAEGRRIQRRLGGDLARGRPTGTDRLDRTLPVDRGEHLLDVEDPIDVGGPQLEHVAHARERGDHVDVLPKPLEHPAATLGALVHDRQAELVVGDGIDDQEAGPWVLGQVATGLREELVRQRDVVVVDDADARQVGDVGRAVGRGRGDDRRHHALEADVQVAQREHRVAHVGSTARGAPAPGPGVWSKISSTCIVQTTKSRRDEPHEQPSLGAVGLLDVGEEGVAEPLRQLDVGVRRPARRRPIAPSAAPIAAWARSPPSRPPPRDRSGAARSARRRRR